MSALNDRIAKVKGWTYIPLADRVGSFVQRFGTGWHNPEGNPAIRPDFTGTLEGVAGMMRELNEHAKANQQYWWWGQNAKLLIDAPRDAFICIKHGVEEHTHFLVPWCWSPPDRPGACVGEAYLSMKEADDGD